MEESKDTLVRAVASQERQVIHVRGLVEANRKKIDELIGKQQMVDDVRRLAEEAKTAQPNLDRSVSELNRLLMRVEALAESENSRNSSNEQVRQINEEIGKAHEELTQVEQQLIQSEADYKAIESEIQSAQFDFDNRAGGAAIRLEQAHKTIHDTRQDLLTSTGQGNKRHTRSGRGIWGKAVHGPHKTCPDHSPCLEASSSRPPPPCRLPIVTITRPADRIWSWNVT
jgi:chromosome segregation ATPase